MNILKPIRHPKRSDEPGAAFAGAGKSLIEFRGGTRSPLHVGLVDSDAIGF